MTTTTTSEVAARLRYLADWLEAHAVDDDQIISADCNRFWRNCQISCDEARRLFPGVTVQVDNAGFGRLERDGIVFAFSIRHGLSGEVTL